MKLLRLLHDQFHRFFEIFLRAWPSMERPDRLARFLNRQPGLRMDVVHKLGIEQGRITEAVSAREMAAILLVWSDHFDHSESHEKLNAALHAGWLDSLGDDFFLAVQKMSRDLDAIGAGTQARSLLRMGVTAARTLNSPDWVQTFGTKLLRLDERRRGSVIRYR